MSFSITKQLGFGGIALTAALSLFSVNAVAIPFGCAGAAPHFSCGNPGAVAVPSMGVLPATSWDETFDMGLALGVGPGESFTFTVDIDFGLDAAAMFAMLGSTVVTLKTADAILGPIPGPAVPDLAPPHVATVVHSFTAGPAPVVITGFTVSGMPVTSLGTLIGYSFDTPIDAAGFSLIEPAVTTPAPGPLALLGLSLVVLAATKRLRGSKG